MEQVTPKEVADAIITDTSRMGQRRTCNADFARDVGPLAATGWKVANGLASKRITPDTSFFVEKHEQGGYQLGGHWTPAPCKSIRLDTISEVLEFVAEVAKELASVGV